MAFIGEYVEDLTLGPPPPTDSRVRKLSPLTLGEPRCDAQPPVVNCPLVNVEQKKLPVDACDGVDSDSVHGVAEPDLDLVLQCNVPPPKELTSGSDEIPVVNCPPCERIYLRIKVFEMWIVKTVSLPMNFTVIWKSIMMRVHL